MKCKECGYFWKEDYEDYDYLIGMDTVNIRKSASTDAEKVAVAYKGEEMEVVQKQADGWTKVRSSIFLP